MADEPTASDTQPTRLGPLTILLAVACGMAVANLYYAQPLLGLLATDFGVSKGSTAQVVTVTQLGYAAGLIFLVPLGDLVDNRRLVTRVLLGTTAALALAAAAPDLAVFLVASLAIGVTSVVAQVLVPLAAAVAPEERRGVMVGRVMSGLLLGILLARTVSGLLASAVGWRGIFALSAGLMLALAAVLRRRLPPHAPDSGLGYGQLLASLLTLIRDEPQLRRRSIYQALMFGTFSVFWTSIAYELASRHHLGSPGIGLFALVGAAGAATAPIAGRLGDAGYGNPATGAGLLAAAVAMVLAGLFAGQLVLLGAAAVLLDASVQLTQVTGQRIIYSVRPEARARMNTVYIATFFLGGAAASALSGVCYETGGWTAVTALGAGLAGLAVLAWLLWDRPRRSGRRLDTREPVREPSGKG